MKTRLLALTVIVVLFSGCQIDRSSDSYSRQRASISSVNVDLKQDILDNKVCEWSAAHSQQEKFLALVNYLRTQPINCGRVVGPTTIVIWNGNLANAAQEHSDDMAQNGKLSHTGSATSSDIAAYSLGLKGGSTPQQRAKNSNFDGKNVVENISKEPLAGDTVTDDNIITAVENLLNSNCENIMDGNMDAFGMAQTTKSVNGKSYSYWTQVFGDN